MPAKSVSPIAQKIKALASAEQVRKLSPEQAAQLVPVKFTGVVTTITGYKNSFFVQDSTAGISVDRTDKTVVHLGDLVEITGRSGPGLFAPVVMASQVRPVGHASPPHPHRFSYGELVGGTQDSQWIEVQGVVHSERIASLFGKTVLMLHLALGGGAIDVTLQDFTGIDYGRLIGSTVRFRGVCSTTFNSKRQFVSLGLYVPSQKDIEVVQLSQADPFASPSTSVTQALQFGQGTHRLKITGIATYQVKGHNLYLQDGKDGIKIDSSSNQVVLPGSIVEAVGFPVIGPYAPILEDGFFRVTGHAAPIAPLPVDAKDVITQVDGFDHAPYDGQLIQLHGTVIESHIQSGQRVWIMQQGRQIFEASLPLSAPGGDHHDIGDGSILSLTGICAVHLDPDSQALTFAILLRSMDDIVILKQASWWTLIHALLLLAVLTALIIVVMLWVVVLRNRVERQTRVIRESEARFRNLAQHDALTGLPNRLMLEDHIAHCLARSKTGKSKAVLFTIDIDRFKQINDAYGHLVGDECLRIVADRLSGMTLPVDAVIRTGGEEFTIIVGSLTSTEQATHIAAAILDLFRSPMLLLDREIKLTVSIGAALYPDDGIDSETLRKRSDQALYEAKRTGRNRAIFASDELSSSVQSAIATEAAIRESLKTGKFTLFYQPILDATRTVRHFEALLRTTDETLFKLGPSNYIPIAEASGLIVPLGRWVLEEACRQIAEWQSLGLPPCSVAVNVSGRQLIQEGFVDEVTQTLSRLRIDPRLLELELTETMVMAEFESVTEAIAELAKAGLTFAVDDFGTGYSSLSRLHELPIKAVKIDRSFVIGLTRNKGARTIVSAIVQMAKTMNLLVIAEGVETEMQFNLLREQGCDLFQGYLFAQPLPAAAAAEFLLANRASIRTAPSVPRLSRVS